MKLIKVTRNGKTTYATASIFYNANLRTNRWFFWHGNQSDFFDTYQEGIDWLKGENQ